MKVEIYSDVVCPWCYIGERRLARALTAFGPDDVEVVFQPYQLDPAAPATPVPVARYLERRFGRPAGDVTAGVTSAAAGEGIAFDWERAVVVNTRTAHRLLGLAAREHGAAVQRALLGLLFDAHFTRGGDVADQALLAELAGRAGMDVERARAYLASDEGESELDAALVRARALGIRAVPTFVFDGRYAVGGAQPASVLLGALEEVRRQSRGAGAGDRPGDAEACLDAGCAVAADRA